MRDKIRDAEKAGKLLLWCDETLFTTKTIMNSEYAARNHNIVMSQADLDFKAEAVIGTIS
jgi:hypothetical protein